MLLFQPSYNVIRPNLHKPQSRDERLSSESGLNNQLFGIVNSIIKSIAEKTEVIVFDGFLTDISHGQLVPMSEIIDFKKTSQKILETTGVKLDFLDRTNISFSLVNAKYGVAGLNLIDVTDKIFHDVNKIIVFPNYNQQFGCDPVKNCVKELLLTINFGSFDKVIILKEQGSDGKIFELTDKFFMETIFPNSGFIPFWYTRFGSENFNKIFRCLVFNDFFYQIADELVPHKRMNIIHLRMESDMIQHLSKIMNITQEEILEKITSKYRESIKFLDSSLETQILTSDDRLSNKICQDIIFNYVPYNIKVDKLNILCGYSGREMCAIIDLIIAIQKSEVFVGMFELNTVFGSTFSYACSIFAKKRIIFINFKDNIDVIEID